MSFVASASPSGIFSHGLSVAGRLVWIDILQGVRKHLSGTTRRDKMLRWGGILFGLTFMVALHLGAFALLAYSTAGPHESNEEQLDLWRGLGTSVWCFLLFVMISGGLVRALVVLHEQDDSNLLLSAPVSPRAILAARLLGNALQSCVVDGFIILPWIDVIVFVFHKWNYVWGYPVWFALAVIVTCIDGLFSFGLIRWFGLRKARLLSQAVPFILVFGVTFFAGSLSVSIASMNLGAERGMPPDLQAHFVALAHSPFAWINRAARGHPGALLSIFSFAALLSWLTLRLTERAFIEGSQLLAEDTGSALPGTADGAFHSGVLRLEIRKGLRLIVRTPMMMVQCISQSLIPIGVACVLGRDDPARGLAVFVIFASGVLSGMFTIAAGTVEECNDLLEMSPRNPRLFRFGKILAGCFWPLAVTLLVAVGLLLTRHVSLSVAVFFGGIPLGLATSLVGETFAKPVRPGVRPKLLADPIMMVPLLGMQIVSGLVAGTTVFATLFTPLLLLAGILASYFILVLAIGLAQIRKPLF